MTFDIGRVGFIMVSKKEERIRSLILGHVPKDMGVTIGNKMLIKLLEREGVSEDDYWSSRESLIAEGILAKRRGKGGAVSLAKEPPPPMTEMQRLTEIKRLSKFVLEEVPPNGKPISNMGMVSNLKKHEISKDLYLDIRAYLIDEGKLGKGPGYGGTVHRIVPGSRSPGSTPSVNKWYPEKKLYPPFKDAMLTYWLQDLGLEENNTVVEVTANQGKRNKPGKWTIPDLTVISVRTFKFVPGKSLDIITFEVKTANDLDVRGVFETAAHTAFAHKSYLAVHLPDGPPKTEGYKRLLKECDRFGIGFMHFSKPDKWGTYEIVIDPVRKIPAAEDVDQFIRKIISRVGQDKIGLLIK